MKKYILAALLLLALAFSAYSREFRHPGILHTNEDIYRMTSLLEKGIEPAVGSWKKLCSEPLSSFDYQLQGPFDTIGRARDFSYTKKPCEDDFNAAYFNALRWVLTGDRRHADKTMEIIRAYSAVLGKIMPPDDPLCSGLQGFIIVNAAELMRYTFTEDLYDGGWTDKDTKAAERMFREAFIPVFTKFHNTPAFTNGNWGLSVLKGMIGMAVFLDDEKMYEDAKSRYLEAGYDNGSLPNYTAESGQLQESGRDQAHCMLGLGCMAEICEVAWHQGEDIYSTLDNRLLTAYEYLSKYNLGHDDLPFFTWTDKTGKYCKWTEISPQQRGRFRSVFEIAYGHYVGRMGLEMPYTEQVLGITRPEGIGWTCDHPGFGSLLFLHGAVEIPSGIYQNGWVDSNKNGMRDIYENPQANIDDRIENLLSQMTIEEKTCQMVTLYGTGRVLKDNLPTEGWNNEIWKDGIGNIDEEHNGVKSPAEFAGNHEKHINAIHTIQKWFIEQTRLGIPVDFTNEGIRGICSTGATFFPAQCGQGATWDKDLIRQIGEVEGREAFEHGYTNIYSPILDIAQDPRWGRCVESYGEDPYHVSQLGKEMIMALQKQNVISTPKHFAVYSIPVGGRDGKTRTDPKVAPREMRTLYLEPFRVAFTEAGALGTMSSYNDYDGVPVSGSKYFLTDILRNEWGFKGYVVSDSEAVEFLSDKHGVSEDYEDGVAQCINAGLNIRTTFRTPESFVLPLRSAISKGKISMETIDSRVSDILRVKFMLGLFENPLRGGNLDVVRSKKHTDLSLRAARESMVLLKNEGNMLPLSKNLKRVAVIGPNADEKELLTSRYGPAGANVITVYEGIKNMLPGAKVSYAKGCDIIDPNFPESEILDFKMTPEEQKMMNEAVQTARRSDVVIMVLGGNELTVREDRSRTSLDLPGRQEELLKAVKETGKPVVLVLMDGRAATINYAQANIPAILHAWFPGEFGGQAVAETLFGDNNPGGKLAVTFPKSVGQIPFAFPFKPGSDESCETSVWGALYPFGYGLSYTTFEYSGLKVDPASHGPHGEINVSVDITNTGKVKGDEVVQLYINDKVSSVTTYTKVLRGFERIPLNPGETKTVHFKLTPQDLGIWDINMNFTVEPGEFEVMVGSSSQDIRLTDKFTIVK